MQKQNDPSDTILAAIIFLVFGPLLVCGFMALAMWSVIWITQVFHANGVSLEISLLTAVLCVAAGVKLCFKYVRRRLARTVN